MIPVQSSSLEFMNPGNKLSYAFITKSKQFTFLLAIKYPEYKATKTKLL